jgi:hypothetical protein
MFEYKIPIFLISGFNLGISSRILSIGAKFVVPVTYGCGFSRDLTSPASV